MKKIIFSVFAFVTALLVSSCGNGSSGSTMLDLDVRIMPNKDAQQWLDRTEPKNKQNFEDVSNLFTVLPGPYEFTWEELKNQDGSAGYEQCATKLKIKLRLNRTLKPLIHSGWHDGELYTDEEMIDVIKRLYQFEMFNSEGKTYSELYDAHEDDEHRMLLFDAELGTIWGIDGKIGYKENKDGLLDFYHFLTSKPGTEFDLIIDCHIQLCKEIENMMEYTKGLYIELTDEALRNKYQFE
jgi:hypothetical protein